MTPCCRSRRLVLSAILAVAAGCSTPSTRLGVSVHIPEGLSTADIAGMTLSISSVDISPPLVRQLGPGELDVAIDVLPGPARLFEVTAYDASGQAIYYGRTSTDLPSSSTVSVSLSAYAAGTLSGQVMVLGGGALPDGYWLQLAGQNPPSPDYAKLQVSLQQGQFSQALPADTYTVTLGGGPVKNALQFTGTVQITQGATTQVTFLAHPLNQASPTLAFQTQPPSAVSATGIFTVAVAVQDSAGNVVTGAQSTISLELQNGNSTSSLGTASTTLGVAQFLALSVHVADSNYTLIAHSPGYQDVTSQPFSVTPGTYSALRITDVPATVVAGATVQPSVAAVDAFGNIVPTVTSALLVSCSADAINKCPGTLPLVAGQATFSTPFAWTTAGSQTVSIFDSASATEISVNAQVLVEAAAAQKLNADLPGSPFQCDDTSTQVSVIVQDTYGNTVTTSSGQVTIAGLGANASSLRGTLSAPLVDGVAHFDSIYLANPNTLDWEASWGTLTLPLGSVTPIPAVIGVNNVQLSPIVNGMVLATFDVANPCEQPVVIRGEYFETVGAYNYATPGPVNVSVPAVTQGYWAWNADFDMPPGTYTVGLHICLLTNDGNPPQCGDSGALTIETGLNNDSFATQVLSGVPSTWGSIIQTADFNNDGILDLVGALPGTSEIQILLGSGGGAFTSNITLNGAGNPNVQGIAVGDLTGDGLPDIVVSYPNMIATYNSAVTNPGTFVSGAEIAFSPRGTPVLADVNRDGQLDIVAVTGLQVAVALNTSGSFNDVPNLFASAGPDALDTVVVADIDLDGWPDAVVASSSGNSAVALRGSTTGFNAVTSIALGSYSPGTNIYLTDLQYTGRPQLSFVSATGGIYSVSNSQDANLLATTTNSLSTQGSGVTPVAMLLADMNIDGYIDVVEVRADGTVDVQLNSSDTFVADNTLNAACNANCVLGAALADFNNDGLPDIMALSGGAPQLWTNGAQIARTLPMNGPKSVAFGTGVGGVAVADYNDDGRPDALVTLPQFNWTFVVWGRGDGTWSPGGYVQTTGSAPTSVASADFNSDGFIDAVVANSGSSFASVLFNSGSLSNTFTAGPSLATAGDRPVQVAAVDVNHDGNADVVALTEGATLATYLGDGEGNFAAPDNFPWGNNIDSFITADINGDGYVDILALSNSASFMMNTLGTGNGVIMVLLGNAQGHFTAGASIVATEGAVSMAAGPIASTTELDLLTSSSSTISLLDADPNAPGGFDAPMDHEISCVSTGQMAFGVMQSGDYSDLYLTCTTDQSVETFINAQAAYGSNGSLPTCSPLTGLGVGDFFGQGLTLPVVTTAGGALATYQQYGNYWQIPYSTTNVGLAAPYLLAVADINHDGTLDVVAADSQNAAFSSTLGQPYQVSLQTGFTFTVPAVLANVQLADINRDGNLDVVGLSTTAGVVSTSLGDGTGNFGASTTVTSLSLTNPPDMALADINRDGQIDIIAAGTAEGITLAQNNNGTFGTVYNNPLAFTPAAIAVGDVNNDGRLDIVTAEVTTAAVFAQLGNGDGTFQFHQRFSFPGQPSHMRCVDFNRDGNLDLIAATPGAGLVQISFGDGQFNFDGGRALLTGAGCNDVQIADIDRDGQMDVISANPADQSIGIDASTPTLPL